MKWSPQQEQALRAVSEWLADPSGPQVFRLFGFAGTGKTTLAAHLAEGIDGDVLFGAYTGKAAHVLRTKGCSNASTIHSLIYHGKEKSRARLTELEAQLGELIHELRMEDPSQNIDGHRRVRDLREMIAQEKRSAAQPAFSLNRESPVRDAALVIIDECSMVNEEMAQDLLYFGTKVLVLGDPAQLPPVMGGGYFTEVDRPDIMLTEIHRQATDNPIIAMATRVRQGERLEVGLYGESEVFYKHHIRPEDALDADQILVGRNKTRAASNARYRQLRRIEDVYPTAGERLVCLRNNHDKGLLNGALWDVDEVISADPDRVAMVVSSDDKLVELEAHSAYFRGEGKDIPWWERKEAEEFDFGYALTVHKSQGSQWDHVLLFDESGAFRQDAWRWLYTGITRAAERIRVVV